MKKKKTQGGILYNMCIHNRAVNSITIISMFSSSRDDIIWGEIKHTHIHIVVTDTHVYITLAVHKCVTCVAIHTVSNVFRVQSNVGGLSSDCHVLNRTYVRMSNLSHPTIILRLRKIRIGRCQLIEIE